jgi:hypothetical protein
MFTSPFLATSPYDFWSRRWNHLVSGLLNRVIFRFRKSNTGQDSKSIQRAAFWGMTVFIFSAVMHEWLTFVAFNECDGGNFIFFIVNGIMATAQILFQKRYQLHNRQIGIIERIILIVCNSMLFISVSKWFLNPFIRALEIENLKKI